MKKVLFTLVLVFVLAIAVNAADGFDVSIKVQDGREFRAQENNCIFLPSYTDIENIRFCFDNGTVTYGNGTLLKSGDAVDISSFYDSNGLYKITLTSGGTSYTYDIYVSSSLPSIFIETSIGKTSLVGSNLTDSNVKISIINKYGAYEYKDTKNTASEIKVRGNTTDTYAKKPFQIKLGEKKNLFSMGKAKTWILLANYLDQSLIRNSVMYSFAADMGMDAPQYQNVDVFLDGEYYGVYTLCEKVQIDEERVNIRNLEKENDKLNQSYNSSTIYVPANAILDKNGNPVVRQYTYVENMVNPEDITGGYLVELDTNNYTKEKCYFTTPYNHAYVVKSPENVSKEQMEYISQIFGYMEQALYSEDGYNSLGKHYTEYIDIESTAYAYIAAEFSRNYDAGGSSTFFYKDADRDGKQTLIKSGPIWDCDNTLGNILKNNAANTTGIWAGKRAFWDGCIKHKDFNALVKEYYEKAYNIIFDMVDRGGLIDELTAEIGSSIIMERKVWHSDDYSKWPFYYGGPHYDTWQSSPVFKFINKYSDGTDSKNNTVIGYLLICMTRRADYLYNLWKCDFEKRTRNIEDSSDGAIFIKMIEETLRSRYGIPAKNDGITFETDKIKILNDRLASFSMKAIIPSKKTA